MKLPTITVCDAAGNEHKYPLLTLRGGDDDLRRERVISRGKAFVAGKRPTVVFMGIETEDRDWAKAGREAGQRFMKQFGT